MGRYMYSPGMKCYTYYRTTRSTFLLLWLGSSSLFESLFYLSKKAFLLLMRILAFWRGWYLLRMKCCIDNQFYSSMNYEQLAVWLRVDWDILPTYVVALRLVFLRAYFVMLLFYINIDTVVHLRCQLQWMAAALSLTAILCSVSTYCPLHMQS